MVVTQIGLTPVGLVTVYLRTVDGRHCFVLGPDEVEPQTQSLQGEAERV
jgi:hypothetical protein